MVAACHAHRTCQETRYEKADTSPPPLRFESIFQIQTRNFGVGEMGKYMGWVNGVLVRGLKISAVYIKEN